VLAIARAEGYAVHALSFRYGQRHVFELESAARQAARWGVEEHVFCDLSIGRFGGSALTDASIEVPQGRTEGEMSAGVPVTYVPARNTVFLAHALALAEVRGANDLFIGVNAIDYSGYPDCRQEFLDAFARTARLATAAGAEGGAHFEIRAPLVSMSKREIVLRARELGVDLALTHSCYDPRLVDGVVHACGRCDACALRLKGCAEAGMRDPVPYMPSVGRRAEGG
jgi:7-cyano-7-deazaguanine synthase